ncbi:MAG: hypothetical protein ACI9YO_002235 [Gammaproteobacteria bacterium]|jgi:hypothetical protein
MATEVAITSGFASFIGYRLIAVVSFRLNPQVILGSAYTMVSLLFIGFSLINNPSILVTLFIIDSLFLASQPPPAAHLSQ